MVVRICSYLACSPSFKRFLSSCWPVGWLGEQPPTSPPSPREKYRAAMTPEKKTTFGVTWVGLPDMYGSRGESMSLRRLLIPTRRGVGGFWEGHVVGLPRLATAIRLLCRRLWKQADFSLGGAQAIHNTKRSCSRMWVLQWRSNIIEHMQICPRREMYSQLRARTHLGLSQHPPSRLVAAGFVWLPLVDDGFITICQWATWQKHYFLCKTTKTLKHCRFLQFLLKDHSFIIVFSLILQFVGASMDSRRNSKRVRGRQTGSRALWTQSWSLWASKLSHLDRNKSPVPICPINY